MPSRTQTARTLEGYAKATRRLRPNASVAFARAPDGEGYEGYEGYKSYEGYESYGERERERECVY
jgi:hypothetical protein